MPFEKISFNAHASTDLIDEIAGHEAIQHDLRHHRSERWTSTDTDLLATLPSEIDLVASATGQGDQKAVFWLDGVLVELNVAMGTIFATYTSAAAMNWMGVNNRLQELFPLIEPEKEHKLSINFWSMSEQGPSSLVRHIQVPEWEEVSHNYSAKVSEKMEYMLGDEFEPGVGGKLLLWHGEPGTGKTFAIRSLGWGWRKWCSAHYITDPEKFFGNPNYMLQVMLGNLPSLVEEEEGENTRERWKLLIIEDASELLTPDARERTGQALSRLLNLTEGLIGQGMNVMILITTNEELKKVHPALARKGRCAMELEFNKLARDDVEAWLEHEDIEAEVKAYTLADLYALKAGRLDREPEPVGFT